MSTGTITSETRPVSNQRSNWLTRHPVLVYGILAYAITWGLLFGATAAIQNGSLPSESPLGFVIGQISASGPALAALVVIAATQGRKGIGQLLRGIVRWRVGVQWYLFALLGIPLIMLSAYSIVYGVSIFQSLLAQWPMILPALLPAFIRIVFETGLAEEPGWRGFALPKIQAKHGPILGSLLLGLFWSLWHLPNLVLQPGGLPNFAMFIAATTVNGFVLTWVYNSTRGSIFMVMLLHAAQNITSSLMGILSGAQDFAQFMFQYSLISSIAFGVFMLVVILLTRGRLGYRSAEETDERVSLTAQNASVKGSI